MAHGGTAIVGRGPLAAIVPLMVWGFRKDTAAKGAFLITGIPPLEQAWSPATLPPTAALTRAATPASLTAPSISRRRMAFAPKARTPPVARLFPHLQDHLRPGRKCSVQW